MPRHSAIPEGSWPRGLRLEAAAQYSGFGETKFAELVKAGRLPQPAKVDGCTVWDRRVLDKALDALYETDADKEINRRINEWDTL